jgi:calcium-dependent protein kinase
MGNKSYKESLSLSSSSSSTKTDNIHITSNTYVSRLNKDPSSDYTTLKTLGEGAFGKVFKVKHKVTGTTRAMKLIKKTSTVSTQDDMNIINEIEILKTLDHPNILKIFEFYVVKDSYYLLTELCHGGELFDEIISRGPFDEKQSAYLIYQILSAVNYCHNMNIVHRDLKPENIFIECRENVFLRVKIGDFGTSKTFDKGTIERRVVGSSYYIAPEVLKKNYNEKCDLWSCGVILFILLSGEPPFNGYTDEEIMNNVKTGEYNLKSRKWDKVSKEAKELITHLLTVDVNKRYTAEQALNHTWFKTHKSKDMFNEIKDQTIVDKFIINLKQYKTQSVLQETALAYLVHNYSQMEDIVEACKLFNQFDTSMDGKVTKNELYKALAKKSKSKTLKDDVDIIFKNMDSDNNGYIQYEEFVRAAIDKKVFLNENVLTFAFNYFDIDKSGKITLDEIENIFKGNVVKGSIRESLRTIIREVDANEDGKISFQEFVQVMTKLFNNDS